MQTNVIDMVTRDPFKSPEESPSTSVSKLIESLKQKQDGIDRIAVVYTRNGEVHVDWNEEATEWDLRAMYSYMGDEINS